MIRHAVTSADLYRHIAEADNAWVQRAAIGRKRLRNEPGARIKNIWSRIKSVYMVLQGSSSFTG